tara:strand:+ start:7525 stop:8151 length:627 start_codon:yes stop_codon:yes gene_type:complete
MMTYKEIDERINHYQEELEWSVMILKNAIKNENYNKELDVIEILGYEKARVEFFSFVTAAYIDLLCTYRNLKRSKTDWEKFYNLRIAYLTIYETINTYFKFKGEIYKSVNIENKKTYKRFFEMLNEELYEFKEEFQYDKIMPKIRNKSSAHYDKNFLEYYSSFEILKKYESKDIIRSFLYFLNPLHYFSFSLVEGNVDEFLFLNSWLS